ncbi:hypothetical protein ACWDSJ_13080 [Nocardia sp. NPDC003482]
MSSETRIPPGSGSRPAVMAVPDILAMSTHGQPAPGRRITLPSGAVWEGGPVVGTSIITLPNSKRILVEGDSSLTGELSGDPVEDNVLVEAFHHVLGVVPKLLSDWVSGLSEQERTRTLKVTSRATFTNPAAALAEGSVADRVPVQRASGGIVIGSGGPQDDSILARLSNGEYVVNAAATAGALPLLEALNAGWVPSAGFLSAMLPGFAAGGLVGESQARQWRDLLSQSLVAPIKPQPDGFRAQDFGLSGWAADAVGGFADFAIGLGGAAGTALGSALAPLFANPGESAASGVLDSGVPGAPDPLTASMRMDADGLPRSGGRAFERLGSAQSLGLRQLNLLANAFGRGLETAATEAGGRVGAALGAVLAPALGPAGALAPLLGAELGSAIGSRFGGSLRASMTVTGETAPAPGAAGNADAPAESRMLREGGPAGAGAGGFSPGLPAGQAGGAGGGDGTPRGYWVYVPNSGGDSAGTSGGGGYSIGQGPVAYPDTGEPLYVRSAQSLGLGDLGAANPTHPFDPAKSPDAAPNLALPQGQSLADMQERYNPYEGNFTALSQLAGARLGTDLGNALAPFLGDQAPGVGTFLGQYLGTAVGAAYTNADTDKDYLTTLGAMLGQATGIPWNPVDGKPMREPTDQEKLGLQALSAGLQGFQQHGLVGGLTSAISSVAQAGGSALGGVIGTAVAPFLGPAGPIAPLVGQMVGSMAAGTAAGFLTRPIEWLANGVKEEVGSGFGLLNLADGPGGRTARGDIYNFNGMDPKSAAIAVERVHRRRTLAQQRGGGLGR